MPEFIGRPRQSSLADLIAQMQARRADPIAQGILQAGQAIGGGIASRMGAAREDDKRKALGETQRQQSIVELLGKGGALTDPTGKPMELPSILGLPAGTRYTPAQDKKSVVITQDMIANYPQIKKLGYEAGDMIPAAVFISQTRPEKPAAQPKAPTGYRFGASGDLEVIPGGPADAKVRAGDEKTASARAAAESHATNVIDAATKALSSIGVKTTGLAGSVMSKVPGSSRKALEGYIDTLKSNLAFEHLQEMRNNSKTGGALGTVSDTELRLLSSAVTALDPNQPPEVLKENIGKIKTQYEGILAKLRASAKEQAEPVAASPAAPVYASEIALTGAAAQRLAELRAKRAAKQGGKK